MVARRGIKVTYYVTSKDAVALQWQGELGFVPHAGLWLDVGDGNYREIEDVYFKAANAGPRGYVQENELAVHFPDDERMRGAKLRKSGWVNYRFTPGEGRA